MIHYSSNIALEKLVVEQLIEGPKGSKLKATLPGTTKLINVSVADRICYLNFDSSFRNTIDNKLTEDVVLYSIVNSLTSLPLWTRYRSPLTVRMTACCFIITS